ncbi:MAG: HNH endonuclease [Gammaproteobacteria bacterium]|nr:MAG: HNH endonuclease [Gammaproteobacteria bacterium]
MAIYNTASDAANTAVRALLTKVGEHYLGRSFNTGSGRGKADWERIRDVAFEGKCCYCGAAGETLQIEHLFMFNRTEYGLHHPRNIVPCCRSCNKRQRNEDKTYLGWMEHLRAICESRGEQHLFDVRLNKITDHMRVEKYPDLNQEERHAIRVIANALYENIKQESERSLTLYKKLDEAFVHRNAD